MVKHTQTIRWQQPANCLSVFDHFVGLVLKEFKVIQNIENKNNVQKTRDRSRTFSEAVAQRCSVKMFQPGMFQNQLHAILRIFLKK